MLHLLHQDRVALGHILAWIQKRFVLLAELLDIRVFPLGQLLYLLPGEHGHRERDGELVQDGNLDDYLVLEPDEQPVKQERNDLLPGHQLPSDKATPKATIPKRQLSLPDTYNLTILGASTTSSPS